MTSNSSKNGDFLFTMPNYIGLPVGNFHVNHQASMPAHNFQGNHPARMPIGSFIPVYQNFQVPGQYMHSMPAQVQQPSLISIQPIPIQDMDVCGLAACVKAFAQSKQWKEADEYAESFRRKCIDGRKLLKLSDNDLLVDLEIAKLGHRQEILRVIKKLGPCVTATCADTMARYPWYHNQVGNYYDSENSVSSIDSSQMSAPVPSFRSGGKYRRNTPKYDRESDRTYYSYGDRENYTPRSSPGFGGAPVPRTTARCRKPGQWKPEEKAFVDIEGWAISPRNTNHEPLVCNGVGANDVQRPKTNVGTDVDNSRETAPPHIDFNMKPVDLDIIFW